MHTNPDNPSNFDLQPLCSLSAAKLRAFVERVELLYQVLHASAPPPGTATSGLDPLDPQGCAPGTPEPSAAIRRTAMRPPTPGSVRAEVYEVLQSAGHPLRPAEITAAVALKRGVPVSDRLTASVGDVLRNPHDHRICKVAPRSYAIAP